MTAMVMVPAMARGAGTPARARAPRGRPHPSAAMLLRRRRVAALLILCAVTTGLLVAGWPALRSEAATPAPPPEHVVVGPGDTVWDLAVPRTPPGERPHAYVAEVLTLNGVDAGAIRPGTVLALPRR